MEITQAINQDTLVKLLFEKTQDVKTEFIDLTKFWAVDYFELAVKENARTYEEWKEIYRVVVPERRRLGNFYPSYTTLSKEGVNRREKMSKIVRMGLEKFQAYEVAFAKKHYENSIKKLAFTLKKKGVLVDETFEITSGKVKQNFECIIKHGGKITKAWTIIAAGQIVRPHYRYLIK